MLADLWNSPNEANAMGCSTTGSSEAAMLAGMAMKRRWEAHRKAKGQSIEEAESGYGSRSGLLAQVRSLLGY